MPKADIPKTYGASDEMEMYQLWEKSGYFNPDNIETRKKPFVIPLPPPNANGDLHVGHTCGYSFQDCMGRYNRMKGHPTLLLPGKDHAGIQTEAVFTKILAEDGVDKWELGREKFYEQCYEFCTKSAENAREQEKRIGLSVDWSREKFTLDPKLTEVIYKTFFRMFEEGLIYRGPYIVNQCTKCKTALANVDTVHKNKKGIFAYIKYPITGEKDRYITVATTRPETMLGDTAVAVHPRDDRYKDLVGKTVDLPLTDRKIPIIAESSVDMSMGTGALKMTPAHSAIDFEIAQRCEREEDSNSIEILNVIDEEGRMNVNAPEKYQNMRVKEARKAVLADLEKEGFLEKTEEIEHEVIVCERCGMVIEQIISNQWFADAKKLAKPAIEALEKGDTKVLPTYKHEALKQWLQNIRPWCISRQLWWGHRIPVWYCGSKKLYDWTLENPKKKLEEFEKEMGKKTKGCGQVITGIKSPKKCPKCGEVELVPEEDIFDTWFSSGQWVFSTLGGPEGEDFKKFYPTDVMETMHDILFFWVARMMMMSLYRTGQTPFHTVYLHGMILAPDGQKMSKSKGNGVEPAEVFKEYGADALRLWYYVDTLPGKNTPIRFEKLQGNRNFVNKIWNASRYVMFQIGDLSEAEIGELDEKVAERMSGIADSDDKWEVATYEAAESITKYLDRYQFNLAVEAIREFFWHTFCDQWIEETKALVSDEPDRKLEYLSRLIALLAVQMKLIHPFAPFVSEKVWQSLRGLGLLGKEAELLMVARWVG